MYNNEKIAACKKCLRKDCNKIFWGHEIVLFDSKGEYERYCFILKNTHLYSRVVLKPCYSLYAFRPHFFRGSRGYIGKITPDFKYYDKKKGVEVIEDYKGDADLTAYFKLRWKILQMNKPQFEYRISNHVNGDE